MKKEITISPYRLLDFFSSILRKYREETGKRAGQIYELEITNCREDRDLKERRIEGYIVIDGTYFEFIVEQMLECDDSGCTPISNECIELKGEEDG